MTIVKRCYTNALSIKLIEKIMNTYTITTERLILRKFSESDLEALFLILRDEEVNKFLP